MGDIAYFSETYDIFLLLWSLYSAVGCEKGSHITFLLLIAANVLIAPFSNRHHEGADESLLG